MTDHIIYSTDGQTYDLTTNRIAFGLLPPDVQEAMKAWSYGWEFYSADTWLKLVGPAWQKGTTYRAFPAPKAHVLYWEGGMAATSWRGNYDTHRIILRDDGKGNVTATVEKL
jgi:hypothetical protein